MSTVRNKNKCIARVSRKCGSWSHPGRCENNAGHGPGRQYCKIHDPAYVATKAEKREVAWQEHMKANRRNWALRKTGPHMLKLCQWIKDNKTRLPVELVNEAIFILRDYEEALK